MLSLLLPVFAFAQNQFNGGYINGFVTFLSGLTTKIFPILTVVALVFFFYELIEFIRATPDKKTEKRPGVLWSVGALFLLLSIFGIIRILQNITGTNGPAGINTSNIPSITF